MKMRFMIYDLRFRNGIFAFILTSYFLLPTILSASNIYFSPISINVKQGQAISVQIFIDPQGSNHSPNDSIYTAKVALSFTPGVLSFSNFSQASGWLPLTQPGYDSVDNSNGVVTKTGGYAGGFSKPQLFGVATFIANTTGIANIAVSNGTQVLNASNQNTFTSGGNVSVNISTPTPVALPPKVQPNPPRPVLNTEASSTTTITSTPSTQLEATTSNLAQVSSGIQIPYNIIIPVITFLVGFALGRVTKFSLK